MNVGDLVRILKQPSDLEGNSELGINKIGCVLPIQYTHSSGTLFKISSLWYRTDEFEPFEWKTGDFCYHLDNPAIKYEVHSASGHWVKVKVQGILVETVAAHLMFIQPYEDEVGAAASINTPVKKYRVINAKPGATHA